MLEALVPGGDLLRDPIGTQQGLKTIFEICVQPRSSGIFRRGTQAQPWDTFETFRGDFELKKLSPLKDRAIQIDALINNPVTALVSSSVTFRMSDIHLDHSLENSEWIAFFVENDLAVEICTHREKLPSLESIFLEIIPCIFRRALDEIVFG